MKYCPNCNAVRSDGDSFCNVCGALLQQSPEDRAAADHATPHVRQQQGTPVVQDVGQAAASPQKRSFTPVIITIVVCSLLLILAVIFAVYMLSGRVSQRTGPGSTESAQGTVDEPTEAPTSAPPQTTVPQVTAQAPETNPPATTQFPPVVTVAPGSAAENSASVLFHPERAYYVEEYEAFCYSQTPGQDYVIMRFGPDKYTYDVVTKLENHTQVTVETVSFDGWNLCVADGAEGWIQTNELYRSPQVVENTVIFRPWENRNYTYIGRTDASVGQQIISSGRISHLGIYLFNEYGDRLASFDYVPTDRTNTKYFFEMNSELGYVLSPNTTYIYQCYAVVGGTYYYSKTYSFTTRR